MPSFRKVTGFRAGFQVPTGADVKSACEVLTGLVTRANGASVDDVIEAARPKRSALRPFLTWDADKALAIVQREEARDLLASLVVEVVQEEQDQEPRTLLVRATALVPDEDEQATCGRYIPIQRVVDDKEKRAMQLRIALKELDAYRRRWWFLERELDGVTLFPAVLVHTPTK